MAERFYAVGVFEYPNDPRIRAYTKHYDPIWKACCQHLVSAESGVEAKRIAIAEHKAKCMRDAFAGRT